MMIIFHSNFCRRLHGQSIGLDDESFSNESDLNEDNQTTKKSIDKGPEDNTLKSVQIQGRDRKVYLKDLEESLRTGRGIRSIDENNDEQSEEDSQNDPSNCFVHFIRKHLHRRS